MVEVVDWWNLMAYAFVAYPQKPPNFADNKFPARILYVVRKSFEDVVLERGYSSAELSPHNNQVKVKMSKRTHPHSNIYHFQPKK